MQSDLDRLLATATGFAREKLGKHGGFFPFGTAISLDGAVKMVGTHSMVPIDQVPKSGDLTALCRTALHRKRDHLRAAAVVWAEPGSHQIRIHLEHHDGVALSVAVPFTRRRLTRSVSLGTPVTRPGPVQIWS